MMWDQARSLRSASRRRLTIRRALGDSLPKKWQDAKRAGRVDEVAHTVALLASDAGSYYIGVTMNMNGGDYIV